jgi:hypothetical protein
MEFLWKNPTVISRLHGVSDDRQNHHEIGAMLSRWTYFSFSVRESR